MLIPNSGLVEMPGLDINFANPSRCTLIMGKSGFARACGLSLHHCWWAGYRKDPPPRKHPSGNSVALGCDALWATGNTESGSASITPGKEQKETFLNYARGNRRDRKAFATRSTTQGSLMKQKLSAVRDTAAVLSHCH